MENDLKYSGKLPLLAYAPQNFGHHAQRSRAYRARAAMGRTGIYSPHRSTVPSAPMTAPAVSLKVADSAQNGVTQTLNTSERNIFHTLWQAVFSSFRRKSNTVNEVDRSPAVPLSVQPGPTIARPHILQNRAVKPSLMDELENSGNGDGLAQSSETPAPVSQAYAALRVNSEPVLPTQDLPTQDLPAQTLQTKPSQRVLKASAISQAPDLAHALAEIRAVLREHERLASEKERSQH